MPHFVKCPNLPSGKVALVAVGQEHAEEIRRALLPFGIKTLSCPNNLLVDSRLRAHIDLSVFHLGENRFVLSETVSNSGFAEELRSFGAEITVSSQKQSFDYPKDAFLCALTNGDRVFHNNKFSDNNIKDHYGGRFLHVNQGYAKCAVCLVSKTAAITSDKGLVAAMRREGIDVLQISAEGIGLFGFEVGFIGGAAFKIAPDTLAFTGTLQNHPNKIDIEVFLKDHTVMPIYLTDKPIYDIGSVIPIMEH